MNQINRKEFLSKVGKGAAFALMYPCLFRCTEMDDPKVLEDNQGLLGDSLEIDLSDSRFRRLTEPGGYLVFYNEVVVARTHDGQYVAATRTCSDEDYRQIVWDNVNHQWLCTQHNATFSVTGRGTTTYNDLGRKGLSVYSTKLEANILTVFIR